MFKKLGQKILKVAAGIGVAAGSSVALAESQVNISGATLFADFFTAPASTNDWIDADGDGIFGYHPDNFPNVIDQLAPTWSISYTPGSWLVQYRGVGSGNGLKEMVNYVQTGAIPTDIPSDLGLINRYQFAKTGMITGSGYVPANASGTPVAPASIDVAVMDVPTTWFVVNGSSSQAAWNRKPQEVGYGLNPVKSDASQSNQLKSLGSLNTNTSSPDAMTVFDNTIAWVPIAFIANRGTGLENAKMTDLQYLYVTGRMPSGENLVGSTRDSGSGTRNGAMNSIGIDPSWGRGDNIGLKTSVVSTFNLGVNTQATNMDGSSLMEDAVKNHRLSVGYTGLAGASRAAADAAEGKYEVLNVMKDILSGTQYVRPSVDAVFHDSDVNTGWQIGGSETMATVGDPLAVTTGNPTMVNAAASAYVRNILKSISDFSAVPSDVANYAMPGEYMATVYSLNAAIDSLPGSNPTAFVPNTVNSTLQNYSIANTLINLPDYGSVTVAGYVPVRNVTTTPYSDGSTNGNYINPVTGTATISSSYELNERNQIMGDFNYDGAEKHVRNINDIAKMMQAVVDPRHFENQDWGGDAGTMPCGDRVIPEIIGDFNGDGNFDVKDIRYFADGLAIDPATGKLDRKKGFTLVDQSFGGNYFGTTLANPKAAYNAGDSRGDVAGNTPTVGAAPCGYDGVVDSHDIDYVFKNFGHWSNLDQASVIDLSCDMNGDLVVDNQDVNELVTVILKSHFGDANLDGSVDVGDLGILAANYGKTSGATWAEGDFNGDGAVDVGDLGILAANYGAGTGGSPDFDADYAKVFGNASATADDTTTSTACSSLGLSLIAALAVMGLMLVKFEE